MVRSVLFGMALALTVTAAPAAENVNSANVLLPYCKRGFDAAMANPGAAYAFGQCVGWHKASPL